MFWRSREAVSEDVVSVRRVWFTAVSYTHLDVYKRQICAFAGLADNSLLDPVRLRYSLGFNWSNLGPILYLFVSSEYIYIRKNKITAIECVVMEIINVFLFKLTDTKMSFAILSVGLVLVFVCTVSDSFKSYVKKILNKFYKGILSVSYTHLPDICRSGQSFFADIRFWHQVFYSNRNFIWQRTVIDVYKRQTI